MTIPHLASWNLRTVKGTWRDVATGALLAGTYTVSIPIRLTNSTDDAMLPAGVFKSGALNITEGAPSLQVDVPCTDDPDIQQTGWQVQIAVTFQSGQTAEQYSIDVPVAGSDPINLRTVVLGSSPGTVGQYRIGVEGGIPLLSSDGLSVLDAFGNPITGSGGGTVTWSTITGKPAIIAAGADQTAARAAIGAGTSSLTLGVTSTTAKAGNYTPPIADLPAGEVLYTTSTTRPTARTDVMVIFKTATDPGSAAIDGLDEWHQTP